MADTSRSGFGAVPPVVPGFQVSRVIGYGATSVVWAGTDVHSGAEVAVKVMAPTRYDVSALMELAERETAILARVHHDHIVAMHEAHPLPDGSVAVVLDLASGGSLADLVSARGRLTEGEVATICTPIASALAALHDVGVIHGDVTPGNIVFTNDGKPMLADFEASRLVGEGHPATVAGTPGYVAPELVAGGIPSPESDVYGLGAVAWSALTGRPLSGSADLSDADRMVGEAFAPVLVSFLDPSPTRRPGADEAAVACYQAAPPEPVLLVSPQSSDPAVALTQRLRAEAARVPSSATGATEAAGGGSPSASRREARQRRKSPRKRVASHEAAEASPALGLPRPASAGAESAQLASRARQTRSSRPERFPPWVKVVGLMLAGIALTAGLIVALSRPGEAAAGSPASAPIAVARPTVGSTLAIATDPQTVLAGLAQARAEALMSGDAAKLTAVHAPQSPILDYDVALLANIKAAGQRFTDLAYHVRHAEWISGDDNKAVVLAVVDRGVYRLVGPGSTVSTVPAEEGRPYTYTLVRTPDGWRISTITQ